MGLTRKAVVEAVQHLCIAGGAATAGDVAKVLGTHRSAVGSHLRNAVSRGELERRDVGKFAPLDRLVAVPNVSVDTPRAGVIDAVAAHAACPTCGGALAVQQGRSTSARRWIGRVVCVKCRSAQIVHTSFEPNGRGEVAS